MKTWQFLWALMRYRPWLYFANGLAWTLIHLSPLVPGLIAKAFFDALTGEAPVQFDPWALIGALIATAAARMVLVWAGIETDVLHRFNMKSLLRQNLFIQTMRRPGARALLDSPGAAISTFRDDTVQVEELISWTVDQIGTLLFAVVALLILLRIDATMTLFVFVPLIAVVVVARLAFTHIERYRVASRAATSRVTGLIGEVFGATSAIQLAGAERHVIAHFRRLNEARRAAMLRDRALTQVLDSFFANTVSLGTGLILLFAAGSMRRGSFTVGDFALFVYYLAFVTEFTQFLGQYLAQYQQTGVAFRRMVALMQGAPPATLVAHEPLYLRGVLPPLPSPARSVESFTKLDLVGLTYSHPESGRGIADVTLRIERGDFVVITGRIGAGK